MAEQVWDIYNCDECTRAFAVEDGDDPVQCPNCNSECFEWSHTMIEKVG